MWNPEMSEELSLNQFLPGKPWYVFHFQKGVFPFFVSDLYFAPPMSFKLKKKPANQNSCAKEWNYDVIV